ncbi:hypothetical protein MLD38_000740 [Melastoma candidum]|uniref:Uncharacterized protein n=1 Tax=Melastoma candidum TaxID=119954 RepID=A0ACB9SG03_9MYRT|nr:hypothetical protein MLD38_000740 [Melastoma candidum]
MAFRRPLLRCLLDLGRNPVPALKLTRRTPGYHSAPRLPPELLSLPLGEKLRETLRRVDGHSPAPPPLLPQMPLDRGRFSVEDARKLLRATRLEMLKGKLRSIRSSTISYDEFLRICDEAGDDHEKGAELARTLDKSGNVIVLRDVVILRPEQVAKFMETLVYRSLAMPNDPRRGELDRLEREKARIDQRARAQVWTELYCGLGLLVAQTAGFMRLTFWELSWDVMEPICFFTASVHFAVAYCFFLRTSTEPSFEGYFRRRFLTKQRKMMDAHKFDVVRYRELRRAFYLDTGRASGPALA